MKIAFVYDPIYPYVIGGAEKRFWELSRRLVKYNHDVYLIGMKYWNGNNRIISEGVHLVGICPAIPLYNKKGSRSFFEPFYFGFFVFLHLLKNSYDTIDCGNFPYISCIAVRLATFFRHTRFVITWYEIWGKEYWINYAGKIGILGYLIEIIVSKLSRHNIALSEFTKKRAQSVLGIKPENLYLVSSGVEYDRLKNIMDVEKSPQIIYVGRLLKHKRIDILMDAFGSFAKSFEDYKLKIIGRGPEKKDLGLQVERLGIKDRVIFIEFLETTDLEKEIKKSKIFILPSEREGLGMVIIEAMSLGTPVIALESEHSAAESIITNGLDGILVKDSHEMAESMSHLLNDQLLYESMVANANCRVAEYDWDKSILPKLNDYLNTN